MKYLTIALISFLTCFKLHASECRSIYSNEKFSLCAVNTENDELFPGTVFDVFAIHKETGNKSYISQEIFLSDVSKVTKVNDTEYFYKAFIGGNSPPSEHRHVLLILGPTEVKNAGDFSGYADIDNDHIKEYFLLTLDKIGSARAFDKYSKSKLQLKNHKLVTNK